MNSSSKKSRNNYLLKSKELGSTKEKFERRKNKLEEKKIEKTKEDFIFS